MINQVGEHSIRFVLLIILQLFVLNNIQFSGFVNPYMYIVFIMLLPFRISGTLMMVLGFFLGLVIDVASTTIGYHTIATVFMTYCRVHLLQFIAPRDGYETGMTPTLKSLGTSWFFKYASLLTVVHHFALFCVESFHFNDLPQIILRTFASSVFTISLIFIYQFLSIRRK